MIKSIALFLSSWLLRLSLFSLALVAAGWIVFGTPDKLKQAADESRLYTSVVDSVIDSAKKQKPNDEVQLPFDQPELSAIAKKAFPAKFIGQSSESIIDGFYAWLKGETESPKFSVDLSKAKLNLANGLGDYAAKRYKTLPLCTQAQLRKLGGDVEPLTVKCRLPNLSSSAIRSQVRSEILKSNEFLGDSTFTADDLPKSDDGKTFAENLAKAPLLFKAFKTLPWILGVLSLLLAIGVVLLSKNVQQGLKSVAKTSLWTGVLLLFGALVSNFVLARLGTSGDALKASLASMTQSLAADYNAALMRFYLPYIILGVGIFIALRLKNRHITSAVPKPRK